MMMYWFHTAGFRGVLEPCVSGDQGMKCMFNCKQTAVHISPNQRSRSLSLGFTISNCSSTIVTSVEAMLLNELPANMGAETLLVDGLPRGVKRGAPRLRRRTPRVVGGRIGRPTPGRVSDGLTVSESTMALTRSLNPGEFVAQRFVRSSLNPLFTATTRASVRAAV